MFNLSVLGTGPPTTSNYIGQKMDVYNQIHPDETPDLISKSQTELHEEVEKLSDTTKAGWLQAKEKCPHLVGDDHTLMFLRCEVFNASVSLHSSVVW